MIAELGQAALILAFVVALLQAVLGINPTSSLPGGTGSTQVTRNSHTDRGYYLGSGYDGENWRGDLGWCRSRFCSATIRGRYTHR